MLFGSTLVFSFSIARIDRFFHQSFLSPCAFDRLNSKPKTFHFLDRSNLFSSPYHVASTANQLITATRYQSLSRSLSFSRFCFDSKLLDREERIQRSFCWICFRSNSFDAFSSNPTFALVGLGQKKLTKKFFSLIVFLFFGFSLVLTAF
jgi:hypothetical protein